MSAQGHRGDLWKLVVNDDSHRKPSSLNFSGDGQDNNSVQMNQRQAWRINVANDSHDTLKTHKIYYFSPVRELTL